MPSMPPSRVENAVSLEESWISKDQGSVPTGSAGYESPQSQVEEVEGHFMKGTQVGFNGVFVSQVFAALL